MACFGVPVHTKAQNNRAVTCLPCLHSSYFEVFVEYAMKMAADDRDLAWILIARVAKLGSIGLTFQQSRGSCPTPWDTGSSQRERERERQRERERGCT